MSDASLFAPLTIQSHRGPYRVEFRRSIPVGPVDDAEGAAGAGARHVIVDERVAALYAGPLRWILESPSVLRLPADERTKSLDRMAEYAAFFLARGIRRQDTLVAIGGGVVQDVACFLASILLRGVDWQFYPTTLLAQADSCIGSKSSINVGDVKNAVGTFRPPTRVAIATDFLHTLTERDLRSGIGEMLKVHVIDGPAAFDRFAADAARILHDDDVLLAAIRRSLEIKKALVERDEFDRGDRLVMNYGHSFGHAIESATAFAVPHGIAVTIGMDLANFVAARTGHTDEAHFLRMHPVLMSNAGEFRHVEIPLDPMLAALSKDKKNVGANLMLILPGEDARPRRVAVPHDSRLRSLCGEYLSTLRFDGADISFYERESKGAEHGTH